MQHVLAVILAVDVTDKVLAALVPALNAQLYAGKITDAEARAHSAELDQDGPG